jgi:hypothetical protein
MLGASGSLGPEAALFDDLVAELRLVRTKGLQHVRQLSLPALTSAAHTLRLIGSPADRLTGGVVEAMLKDALQRFGGGRAEEAAAYTFGIIQGSRMWSAGDRRRAAARAQGVSVERFRKGYELNSIKQLAECLISDLAAASATPGARGTVAEDDVRLSVLSGSSLLQLGRRRTAYPLDLSLAELVRSDLFVGTALMRYGDDEGHRYAPAEIATALAAGRSCLLLGDPGAGKSLMLYKIAVECTFQDLKPIVVRAGDLPQLAGDDALAEAATGSRGDLVLLVDGLDEAIAGTSSGAEALRELSRIGSTVPTLITCRTREYEETPGLTRSDEAFDDIYELKPWSVAVEFRDYLDRLAHAGLVVSTQLYRAVVESRALSSLAARPLYARMLTFVGERIARDLVSTTHLYGEYMAKLARVADVALERRSGPVIGGSLHVWKEVAWSVHTSRAADGHAIRLDEVEARLTSSLGDSGHNSLDYILDRRLHHGIRVAEFIHYSFYEYLLAARVCSELLDGRVDLLELLRRDLSREVRHHLVGQLVDRGAKQVSHRLLEAYTEASRVGDASTESLAVRNLIIYMLSRTADGRAGVIELLTDLLIRERSEFLRSALIWALCHLGSDEAVRRFVAEVESGTGLFSATCRGYVLYYYGDVDPGEGPPYVDNEPYRPATNTRMKLAAMFRTGELINEVAPQRTFVDVYTFIDLLVVRGSELTEDEASTLRGVCAELAEDISKPLMDCLGRLFDQATRMGEDKS